MTTITLTGEPRSTNSIYRHMCMGKAPRVYMTNEGKALKESYQWEAKSQWKDKPIKEPLKVKIELFFKVNRVHDIDNYGKILFDALSGIVWEDDGQIQAMSVTKWLDKDNPRIEITIL